MARRHWLDPLARQLLRATGQLPQPAAAPGAASQAASPADDHASSVERELLLLRLRQDPGCALRTGEEVVQAAALGWRLDVNRASASDWRRLPGIECREVFAIGHRHVNGRAVGEEEAHRVTCLVECVTACFGPRRRGRRRGTRRTACVCHSGRR